jgi:signal peptidase I
MERAKRVEPEHPEATTSNRTVAPRHFLLLAFRELVGTILPAVVIALFINVFIARAMVIDGPSMQPNLYYNERVIVEKATYQLIHGPRRGEVVVINVPGEPEPLIKRVVAMAGETVEIRDGQVFIDGVPLAEEWRVVQGGPDYPVTSVPPLHVFVLGDNRANSRDSRYFGPVPVRWVIGRALFVYWPPDQINPIH